MNNKYDIESIFCKGSMPEENLNKYKEAGNKFGKVQWSIPYFISIPLLVKVVDEDWDGNKIEKYCSEKFYENDEKRVLELFEEILKDIPEKYIEPIKEIKIAYLNKRYLSCQALLFAVVNGLVVDYNGRDGKGVTVDTGTIQELGDYNSPIIYAYSRSINYVLAEYFKGSGKTGGSNGVRNNLMHGFEFVADKNLCIKLLNSVYGLLFLMGNFQYYGKIKLDS